jgi:hypothetical protein
MPADRALRNARLRWPASWTRPSGSPRKIVSPAMAPSRIVWVVDTPGLLEEPVFRLN